MPRKTIRIRNRDLVFRARARTAEGAAQLAEIAKLLGLKPTKRLPKAKKGGEAGAGG